MSENSANNKRIAKNTAFLYIRMLLILLVTLYTSRVVLRTLGVTDYGVYNVVAGFVSMFAFMNVSLANGTQRFYNYSLGKGEKDGIRKVYVTAILIQALIASVLLLLIESFGIWYINNVMVIPDDRIVAANWVFQCSAVSMILMMMQIPYTAIIMAYEKMDYYAVVGIVDVVLKLGIVFLLPIIPVDRLQLYGILMLMVAVVDFAMYFCYSKKHFPDLVFSFSFERDLFKSMLGFSGWNIFGTFAFMMKGQGLNILLNAFFGPVVNAARGIAVQVMSGLQGFSANILVAFRPQLIQSYAAKNYERVKTIFFSESKISYLLLCIMMTPFIIEIDYILNLWLGIDSVPAYTKSFTILVLLNMLVSALHQPLTHIIHATGRQKTFQLLNAVIVFSIVPVSWIFLILGFDPNSVFVVSLIITIINIIVSILVVRLQFTFSLRAYCSYVLLPCLIVTILLPLLPYCVSRMMDEGFVRLVCVLLTELLVGIPLLYYTALTDAEKTMMKSLINKKIRK